MKSVWERRTSSVPSEAENYNTISSVRRIYRVFLDAETTDSPHLYGSTLVHARTQTLRKFATVPEYTERTLGRGQPRKSASVPVYIQCALRCRTFNRTNTHRFHHTPTKRSGAVPFKTHIQFGSEVHI